MSERETPDATPVKFDSLLIDTDTGPVLYTSEPRSGEAQPDDVRRANEWLDRWQPGDEEPNLLSPLLALLAEARTDERKRRERAKPEEPR